MYTLSRLKRNNLITVEEVLFHAPTTDNVDPRMVEQSIIIAEERFIRTELGTDMYEYMCDSKNVTVTTGNITALQAKFPDTITLVEGDVVNAYEQLNPSYQQLWLKHLWKIVAECVIASAYPEAFVQFSSEGVFHKVPPAGLMVTSGLVTPLLSSTKWVLDKKIQDRISPLLNSMHNYICKYKTTDGFDLYVKECPEDCNGKAIERKKFSGLALDIYDNEV